MAGSRKPSRSNAQEISELGRELHERIAVMAGHWSKVGKNLGDAVGAYNKAVASLESRVLVSARRFKELKAIPDGREIAEVERVEVLPRALPAQEMLADCALLGVLGPAFLRDAGLQHAVPGGSWTWGWRKRRSIIRRSPRTGGGSSSTRSPRRLSCSPSWTWEFPSLRYAGRP